MVSPLNLMLFGCKKVDFVDGCVRLDNWLNFDMNPDDAAVVCALRKVLDEILVHVVAQPEEVLNMDESYQNAIAVIRSLAEFSAGDFQISREQGIGADRESNFGRPQGGSFGPSGFGGGKFQRTDSGPSGNFNSGGNYNRGGFNSGYQRGNYGPPRGFNRGGFNNRRGFGFGRSN